MSEVIETRWPQHGQETISSNVPLFVFWITRTMDWGRHNWVWDKPPVSQLKLSQFHQDQSPHLIVISIPGHGILSRYLNSHFTGTMVKHPHHDNIEWMGLGQWFLTLYYLSRSILYPHPVQSLQRGAHNPSLHWWPVHPHSGSSPVVINKWRQGCLSEAMANFSNPWNFVKVNVNVPSESGYSFVGLKCEYKSKLSFPKVMQIL